jgi:hypothetical protein
MRLEEDLKEDLPLVDFPKATTAYIRVSIVLRAKRNFQQHTYAVLLCVERLGIHDTIHRILPTGHLVDA